MSSFWGAYHNIRAIFILSLYSDDLAENEDLKHDTNENVETYERAYCAKKDSEDNAYDRDKSADEGSETDNYACNYSYNDINDDADDEISNVLCVLPGQREDLFECIHNENLQNNMLY